MSHTSIKLNTPSEFINITPINPFISKCNIKVCYVSDEPNRNRSVITKEVAKRIANSLPGSPIVGYYDLETKDFEEHSRELLLKGNRLVIKDKTRPYGFVDLNARCWFQKFLDDGKDEREYLMTEGYLWTGQYPEAQQIVDDGGKPQSMELAQEDKYLKAHWTKGANGKPEFFIINEALIKKLCVLGDEYEPCFEGSNIESVEFCFEKDFTHQLSNMIFQLQNILNEGGKDQMEFKKQDDEKLKKDQEQEQEDTKGKAEENKEEEDDKKKKKTNFSEDKCPECGKPLSECTCKKSNYSLEDIPEYTELRDKYSKLEEDCDALSKQVDEYKSTIETLENTVNELTEFKSQAERKEKEDMINSFYMLSDEDKKEVVEKIDTYSVSDIEAKLSVICFRNKVNFNLEDNEEKQDKQTTYTLEDSVKNSAIPAWVQAVQENSKEQ